MASWVVDDRSWISRTVDTEALPRISSANAVVEQGGAAAANVAEPAAACPSENVRSLPGPSRATRSTTEPLPGIEDDAIVQEIVKAKNTRLLFAKVYHFPGPEKKNPSEVGAGASRDRLTTDRRTGEMLPISPRTVSLDCLVFDGPKEHTPKQFRRSSMTNLPSPYKGLEEDREDSLSNETLSIARHSETVADGFRSSRLSSIAHRAEVHDRIRIIRRIRARLMRTFFRR